MLAGKQLRGKLYMSSTEPTKRPLKPNPSAVVFDTRQAASYLGFERRTLEMWRTRGNGPLFIRTPSRRIRYSISALDAWLADHEMAAQ